jgi:hypothetical protein
MTEGSESRGRDELVDASPTTPADGSNTLCRMWPATGWDDADWDGSKARGWTVMGRLRARQRREMALSHEAKRQAAESSRYMQMMTASTGVASWRNSLRAGWRGGQSVVAFLFSHPDAQPIADLDARGEYFDCRTGDSWDLFFPGSPGSRVRSASRLDTSRPRIRVGLVLQPIWLRRAAATRRAPVGRPLAILR